MWKTKPCCWLLSYHLQWFGNHNYVDPEYLSHLANSMSFIFPQSQRDHRLESQCQFLIIKIGSNIIAHTHLLQTPKEEPPLFLKSTHHKVSYCQDFQCWLRAMISLFPCNYCFLGENHIKSFQPLVLFTGVIHDSSVYTFLIPWRF